MIRELTVSDAAVFWSLRLRAFTEEPLSFGSSSDEAAALPATTAYDVLARVGRSPFDFVLGAFDDDAPRLIGIVGLERERRRKRAHRAKVWGMYVVAEARGRRVARSLMVELIARARRIDGVDKLLLSVMAHNAAAIRLYESLGFETYGNERDAMRHDGASYDEYSMALRL